jgi:phosphocarrier protein HPr
MQEKKLVLSNKLGLHARASMKLTDLAMAYASHIEIGYHGRWVSAKSIMDVMVLGACYEQEVTIRAHGDDEEAALLAIAHLIHNRFGELE